MDFPKVLKEKQLEMGMTVAQFARYLGKSRQFLIVIFSNSPKLRKYRLSELTMYSLNKTLGIEQEIMDEYNKKVVEHNGRIEKPTSR